MSTRVFGILFGNLSALCLGVVSLLGQSGPHDQTVALIKEQVSLDGGIVDGNVQLTAPLNFTIAAGFTGDGFLLLPGSPAFNIHRQAVIGSLEEGDGSLGPSDYTVRLQARVEIPGIRTRVDPPEFPAVSPPPAPTGHLDIRLTRGDTFEGDFADIRNLTLANDAGPIYLPPGHYGELQLQRGARLVIGVARTGAAAHYTFTSIDWFQGAHLELLGPVMIETASFPRPVGGVFGNPDRPEWLFLGITTGDWTLDRGAFFYGTLAAPQGVATVQSTSSFCGRIFARELALKSNASLRFCGPSNQQPLAEDIVVTTIQGQPVSFELLGFDPDGDALSFVLLTAPENGELSGEAPAFNYTPFEGFTGEEILVYVVSDGELTSEEAIVRIIVEAVNQAPTAADASFALVRYGELTADLMPFVSDPDGDDLAFEAVSEPAHGELQFSADGLFTYTPGWGFFGEDAFTYRVSDGELQSEEALVQLQIGFLNYPPVAEPQEVFTHENIPLEVILTATDFDDDELTYAVASEPANGVLTGTAPVLTYTPTEGFFGFDSFLFVASDGHSDSEPAIVSIEVNALPRVMITEPASGSVIFAPANITFTIEAADPDGTVQSVALILDGDVLAEFAGESATFEWESATPGLYFFQALAIDDRGAAGESDVLTITIRDNLAPLASDQEVQAVEDAGVEFALDAADPDGDPLQFILMESPAAGSVEVVESGVGIRVRYTPEPAFVGADSFAYRVSDGLLDSEVARVDVDVIPDPERIFVTLTADRTEVTAVPRPILPRYAVIANHDEWALTEDGFSQAPTVENFVRNISRSFSPLRAGKFLAYSDRSAYTGASLRNVIESEGHEWIVTTSLGETLTDLLEYDGLFLLDRAIDNEVLIDYVRGGGSVYVSGDGTPGGADRWNAFLGEFGLGFETSENSVAGAVPVSSEHPLLAGVESLYSSMGNDIRLQGEETSSGIIHSSGENNLVGVHDSPDGEWRDYVISVEAAYEAIPEVDLSYEWTVVSGDDQEVNFVTAGPKGLVVQFYSEATVVVEFWVSDGIRERRRTIELSGRNPEPPRIVSEPAEDFVAFRNIARSYEYQIEAESVEGGLRFRLESAPEGAFLDANSGFLEWAVGYGNEGAYSFSVTVADRIDSIATQTWTVEVKDNQPPAIFLAEPILVGSLDRQVILAALVSDGAVSIGDLSIEWRQVFGPADAVIASPFQAETVVDFAEEGVYLFEIMVSDGDFETTATVEVHVGGSWPVENPAGLVAWWTGNHTAIDAVAGIPAVLMEGTDFSADGRVNAAFAFNGSTSGMSAARQEALDLGPEGVEGSFSIEFWVEPWRIASEERIVEWRDVGANRNGVSLVLWGSSQMLLRVVDSNGSISAAASTAGLIAGNQWRHVAVTYDHQSGFVTFYRNGAFHSQHAVVRRIPETSLELHVGYREGALNYFRGLLDELSFYNRALRAEEVSYIHGLGGSGKSPPVANRAPVVSAGPDIFLNNLNDVALLEGSLADDGLPYGEVALQWRQISGPGQALFGEASATTTVSFTEPGIYVVELEADDGMYVSRDRTSVRVALPCETENPANLAAWWPWNGTLDETIHGLRTLPRQHAMEYADGEVSGALAFDGVRDGLQVERATALDIGRDGSFTLEVWLHPTTITSDARILEWRDEGLNRNGVSLALWGTSQMILRIFDASGASSIVASATGLVTANQWRHIAVSYEHEIGLVTFYRNGVFHSQHNVTKRIPETSLDLYIGYLHPHSNYYTGMLDELSLYSRALRSEEISLLYGRGGAGKCMPGSNMAPEVSAGPDLFLHNLEELALLDGSAADDGAPFGELTLQWRQISGPGEALFGESSAAVTTVGFTEPGIYVLELAATDGMYSSIDRTTARVALPCESENPPGLAAWWPWNGSLADTIHGLDTVPRRHSMAYAGGTVSSGLTFDGLRDGLLVERSPALDIGAEGDFSVEFWVRPSRVVSDERILEWRDSAGNRSGVSLALWGTSQMILRIFDAGGNVSTAPSATGLVAANQWRHIAVTYEHEVGRITFYRDGAFQSQQWVTKRLPETSLDLYIGYQHPNQGYFQGVLDELSLYNRALESAEISFIHARGEAGKCPPNSNLPPAVSAGSDLFVESLFDPAVLEGAVTDDGLPFGDLTLEWRKLSGPGEATFAAADQPSTTVSFTEPGIYLLELEAQDGMYTTRDRVSARVALPCEIANPPGLSAWWPWNGTLLEQIHGLNTVPRQHAMDYADGVVSRGLVFDGSRGGLSVEGNPALDIGGSGSFSIEFWTRPSRIISDERIVEWRDVIGNRNGVSLAHWGASQLILRILDSSGGISSVASATGLVATNQWRHIAVTYDHDLGQVTFYRNGAFYSQQAVTRRIPETSLDLFIGYRHPNLNHFQGSLDELSLYNRALDGAEVAAVYNLGSAGKCPVDQAPLVAGAEDDSDGVMMASEDSGYTLTPAPAPLMSTESPHEESGGDGGAASPGQAAATEEEGEQWVFEEGLELALSFNDPDSVGRDAMLLRFLGGELVEIAASGHLGIYTYTVTANTAALLEIILSHQTEPRDAFQFSYYKLLLEYDTGDEGRFEGWLVLDEADPERQTGNFAWR